MLDIQKNYCLALSNLISLQAIYRQDFILWMLLLYYASEQSNAMPPITCRPSAYRRDALPSTYSTYGDHTFIERFTLPAGKVPSMGYALKNVCFGLV